MKNMPDPKIIQGNFGKVIFCDCLDTEFGLPSINEKYQMTLTDPPYNIDAKICKGMHYGEGRDIEIYDDLMPPEKYREWCEAWFSWVKSISKLVCFTCGRQNVPMWFQIADVDFIVWEIRNCCSRGFISKFMNFEPMIVYPKNWGRNKLDFDVLEVINQSGFMHRNQPKEEREMKFPHPKPGDLYERILRETKVKSVCDPFTGSGRLPMIAEKLGLKYIAYEKRESCMGIIDYMVKKGIFMHKQSTLDALVSGDKLEKEAE
jgi:DNA modification methylase